MTTDETRASSGPHDCPHYAAAREAFDRLDPADKAAFLLESAFGAAGEMVAEAARSVADVVDRAANAEFWRTTPATDAGETAGPGGPVRPPQKRRPPSPGAADAGSPPSPGIDPDPLV